MSLTYSVGSTFDMSDLPVGVLVLYWVIMLAICVVAIVADVKIFQKAGKPGWHAIIPFLSTYDMFDFAWGNGVLFLLTFIPFVNIVVLIMLYVKLAKAFGKDTGFAVGLIFLPLIFLLILAFGDAQYIGPDGTPRMAPGYPQQGYPQQPYPQQGYPQQPQYGAPPQQQQYRAPQQPQYGAPQQQQQYRAPQQPYPQQQPPQQQYPQQQQYPNNQQPR